MSLSATERFGSRVENYRRWRPGYPPELFHWLFERAAIKPGDSAADIGSGTGLFTRDLLTAGLRVFAIEPNEAMRAAAEGSLGAVPGFHSCKGTAEATGLEGASVSLVTAAQSFHWFEPAGARAEFARILKPGGHAALIWNLRRDDTPALMAYEALLRRYAPDYVHSGRPAQAHTASLQAFFDDRAVEHAAFSYTQHFDRFGLRGRLLSSSYTPPLGAPGHEEMLDELDALFDQFQENGRFAFYYETRAYMGSLH